MYFVFKYKINCIYVFQILVCDFHDIYIRIWDSGYSCQCLLRFTYFSFSKAVANFKMGDKLSDNMFETLLLLKVNVHINCVL